MCVGGGGGAGAGLPWNIAPRSLASPTRALESSKGPPDASGPLRSPHQGWGSGPTVSRGWGEWKGAGKRAAGVPCAAPQGSLWACAQHSCSGGELTFPPGILSGVTWLCEASEKSFSSFGRPQLAKSSPVPAQLTGLVKMTSFHAAKPFSRRKTC